MISILPFEKSREINSQHRGRIRILLRNTWTSVPFCGTVVYCKGGADMAQMSLEELYRGEGAGEKYGILGEVMKDFFENGRPSEYDERTWLEMLLVKHALMAAEK